MDIRVEEFFLRFMALTDQFQSWHLSSTPMAKVVKSISGSENRESFSSPYGKTLLPIPITCAMKVIQLLNARKKNHTTAL